MNKPLRPKNKQGGIPSVFIFHWLDLNFKFCTAVIQIGMEVLISEVVWMLLVVLDHYFLEIVKHLY